MINFLKKWYGQIGELKVEQVASPAHDGEKLHVTSLFRTGGINVQAGSGIVDFADVEKLGDDSFRLALARAAAEELVLRLRADANVIEAALAVAP
jgi:hypothetical protein